MNAGKILIVDDEKNICTLLKRFLTSRGYTVITANSAREGILKLKKAKPAIVLLDIRMPLISGIKALRLMRKIDKQVDIIMATGVRDNDIALETQELGATEYIVKPYNLEHVLNVLRVHLASKALD